MSNARFSILQARAVTDERVSDAQFRTLAALGCYGDPEGWCFPSLSTLGNKLHKSPQAVSKDIKHLVEVGYIEKHPRFNEDGGRRSNLYRLRYDLPPSTSEVDTPPTSEVDTLSTPVVEVNDPINDPINQDRDRDIFRALEELTGGLLRSDTPRMVDTWKEKHPFERIMQAIALAKAKGRMPVTYVDSILIGWEANGYPKSREQQVQERKAVPAGAKQSVSSMFEAHRAKQAAQNG